MSQLLKEELHLHLYGCLTPEDIFELGKDRFQARAPALEWFASEYETHVGRRPDWQQYWQSSAGLDRIKEDFLATHLMRFPQFQARFNLMIALLPTTEHAVTVLDQVVPNQVKQGISYSEFRIFVPPMLGPAELKKYFETLADGASSSNSTYKNAHTSRVVLSVSRNPQVFMRQYEVLRDLQNDSKNVAEQIVALDFCGVEEGFPPEHLKQIFQIVHNDNSSSPEHALAILYHVGESFDEMSIFSAMRWIYVAAQMGAHRLGHAAAAGVRIRNTGRFADGQVFFEPILEAQMLLDFLKKTVCQSGEIGDVCNYLDKTYKEALLKKFGKDRLEFVWNADLRHAGSALQAWILDQLVHTSSIVETCPTSNRIIGRIEHETDLPVFQFCEKKVPLVISSDDPGIFATTLSNEENICLREDLISAKQMQAIAKNNQRFRAGVLAGRSAQ